MEASASFQPRNPTAAQRYALAVLAAVLALVLREALSGLLGTTNPYHTVWAAVVFSAWYCGVWPAIVTTILSLIGVWCFFVPPLHSFRLEHPETAIPGAIGFVVLSGLIIAVGEANRRAQTNRRSAEAALGDRESEFHLLADSIPELCWMARGDGHVFWYNARWYEYTGTTPKQMEGWGWQSVHEPEVLPSVLERWKASLASGQNFEMEFPLRGADGVFRWFLTRVRPVRDGEGKVVRWFGTATNIHEHRELRQSLIEARQELEQRVQERTAELAQKTAELWQKATLLDLANDAILVRDAAGRISYWNEGAERLYGWTSAEVLGRSTSEFLRTQFPVPLSDILHSDRWVGELRQNKRDGSAIVVASRWTTLRDDNGKPAEWLEINTDITARIRAETAARKLSARILTLQDEERRHIARGLHDSLGQYLTALKMSLHSLSVSNGNQDNVVAECSEIVDKCLTETRTISHLLHPPLLDEAGLRSAIQWCVGGFAQRSGITVNVDLPTQLDRFPREMETTLFRVVQEALTNIHRHSGASAADIRLVIEAKHARLEISDNGKGIPKPRLRSVMESGGETGVGLAGMRERVRESGGVIEIESETTGTLLRVTLPIVEPIGKTQTEERGSKGLSAA